MATASAAPEAELYREVRIPIGSLTSMKACSARSIGIAATELSYRVAEHRWRGEAICASSVISASLLVN